jgi:hypothetical protein
MQPRKMMGFEALGDQKIPVSVRDWNGMKLALWRSKVAWDIAERAASEILGCCEHEPGCAAQQDETEPCLSICIDRELRMSALVVLNAARMFAPIDARQPAAGPYMAPSREYFSEIVVELGAAQLELDVLREALRVAGIEPPSPPENTEPRALPAQRATKQLVYEIPDDGLADPVDGLDDAVQAEETAT